MTAAGSTSPQPSNAADSTPPAESNLPQDPTDQAVLDYLKKKGLSNAVLELKNLLKTDSTAETPKEKDDSAQKDEVKLAALPADTAALRTQLESEDNDARNQRSILTKSTGGGFGYDRDAAAPIVQWGVPDASEYYPKTDANGKPIPQKVGEEEAKLYLDAFVSLQLWVLNLPDDDGVGSHIQPKTNNVLAKAKELIQGGQAKEISLSTFVQKISKPAKKKDIRRQDTFALPPSAKPELLSVSFALLVHTYCELLEVGMESTAHVLRDAFQPVYDPIYGQEYKDLFTCTTTEDIMRLNTHNSQHMEALASCKAVLYQISQVQYKKEEYRRNHSGSTSKETQMRLKAKLQELDQTIKVAQTKYAEVAQRASLSFSRMHDLPFLRRARAVRWQLTLSAASYGLLSAFLNTEMSGSKSSLLAMSTLLQTKCELHVERREPLPYTPAVVMEDNTDTTSIRDASNKKIRIYSGINEKAVVRWAAPAPRMHHKKEVGSSLPFPKFRLDEEYTDQRQAVLDKRSVAFNRALLVNGFRRLEALERKREYQTTKDTGSSGEDTVDDDAGVAADPLKPSILLSTLSSNTPMAIRSTKIPTEKKTSTADASAIWEESGVGLTCGKICPPDGRYVAVGCDDSAVRIWKLDSGMHQDGSSRIGEPCQVLLGHKNGFPVFDVDWNRDGRCLLSAGGDGSIRLWDTQAQGPYGDVGQPRPATKRPSVSGITTTKDGMVSSAAAKQALDSANKELLAANQDIDMTVPGLREELNPYTSGAALSVYRGHAPSTPVWSVAFAPSGYYFASAGGDATARLWVTDRSTPVRLFVGHTSNCVHSVEFHPNCNYILTGCEDKTARLWDIQTGRCVRLLNGCHFGVHAVKVSPDGQYATGADTSGIVHLWDLGTGKKVSELCPKGSEEGPFNMNMVHAMSFSQCGSALATAGDDSCVRVWDIRRLYTDPKPVLDTPAHVFPATRTVMMDLSYTKRNLLLGLGKYASGISLITDFD